MAEDIKVLFVKLKLKGTALQWWKRVEGYSSAFDNLTIQVGLNEINEQLASRYLSGLHQSIRDEMGVVQFYNLEDARQYALMAEKRLQRRGNRKPTTGCFDGAWQKTSTAVCEVHSEQAAGPSTQPSDMNG